MKTLPRILLVTAFLTFMSIGISCSVNDDRNQRNAASLVTLTADQPEAPQEPLVMRQFRGCKAHQ